jgi:cytoskeletal protein CcmA (bactofilin family)
MQNMKIDGAGSIDGGEYGIVEIDGMATCTGDLSAESVQVDGMFKCKGSLKAGRLHCDGMAKIQGNVKAGRIEANGMLAVKGGTKIEADEIDCDGMIKIDGEISADRIMADGCIDAAEITGDSIVIHSHGHFFIPFFRTPRSRIKLIEATTIALRSVVAESVNGKDIRIERGCRIESIDCSGTLWISPWASVRNVSGNYSMANE